MIYFDFILILIFPPIAAIEIKIFKRFIGATRDSCRGLLSLSEAKEVIAVSEIKG